MAAPTYNCPFSASNTAAATCAQVLAMNSNAGCAMYDAKAEHCSIAKANLAAARTNAANVAPTG